LEKKGRTNGRRVREDERKRLEKFLWRRNLKRGIMSRLLTMDLTFIFVSYFIFSFPFLFFFLFLEQLGLGVISHAVTT